MYATYKQDGIMGNLQQGFSQHLIFQTQIKSRKTLAFQIFTYYENLFYTPALHGLGKGLLLLRTPAWLNITYK